jgi:hypothetical protein
MDKFERIQHLRDDYESSLDEAERLRDEYHREIVKLHRSGMSLREIAEGLGISHQRVHQIVSPHEERPTSRKKRTAVVGGTVATLLLLAGAGLLFLRSGPSAGPQAAPTSAAVAASCVPPVAVTGSLQVSPCSHAQAVAGKRTIVAFEPAGGTCGSHDYALFMENHQGNSTQPTQVEICSSVVAIDPKTGQVLATAGQMKTLERALPSILAPGP